MRWLLLVYRYVPEYVGGLEIYVLHFSEALVKQGHSVTILTSTNDSNLPKQEVINGVKIIRIFSPKGSLGPLRFQQRKHFSQVFRQLIQDEKFDIINLHTASMLQAKDLLKHYKECFIFTFHAVHTYELIFDFFKFSGKLSNKIIDIVKFPLKVIIQYFFEYKLLKYSDHVVVMSEYVKGTVQTFFPTLNLDKLIISAIGISPITTYNKLNKTSAKEILDLPKDKTIFLTVRRLVPRMGIQNLIKAFKLLDTPDALLFIIGKGELFNYFNKIINNSGLSERVKLLGFVDDEKLHQYYSGADCFILPTEQLEGFGIVTIEALSYGLPVIGTPRGATPEILTQFDKELLAKSPNPDDLKKAIKYFLNNKEKYKCSDDRKNLANSIYDWKLIINNLCVKFDLSKKMIK